MIYEVKGKVFAILEDAKEYQKQFGGIIHCKGV